MIFLGLRDEFDAPGDRDEYGDIVFLSAFPSSVVCFLVLALIRRLLALRVLELLDGCIGQDGRQLLSFTIRSDLLARQLLSEVFDDGEYLVLEQIIKHAVGGGDNDIPILKINSIVVGAIRLILAHVVLLLQNLPQSRKLITLALLTQNIQVSLGGQLRKLIRNIECMLLLLRPPRHERLSLLKSNQKES